MSHEPVLLKEVIEGLNLEEGLTVVDGTINRGGHAIEIAKLIGKTGTLIGLDKDGDAIDEVKERLENCDPRLILENIGYEELGVVLDKHNISYVDRVLLDLGLSSHQLEESKRGFSFQKDEPLLMTFSERPDENELTARVVVNEWEEDNLSDIIYGFGGERYARRIAKQIVEEREVSPIKTTFDLVRVISNAVPNSYKQKRIHFATKTFQAIRMAVNGELDVIKNGLQVTFKRLSKRGELLVISFHEHEDRLVKRFMKDLEKKEFGEILTKKPIVPNKDEISKNPRARSAKLRIIRKICSEKEYNQEPS